LRSALYLLPFSRLHLDLLSFPTLRSSDLIHFLTKHEKKSPLANQMTKGGSSQYILFKTFPMLFYLAYAELNNRGHLLWNPYLTRSEEHTSELESRFDIVCRLLLEINKRNY